MSNRYAGRTDLTELRKKTEQTESEHAVKSRIIDEARQIRTEEMERRRQEEDSDVDSTVTPESITQTRLSNNNNTSRHSNHGSSLDLNHSTTNIGNSFAGSCRNLDHRDLRSELSKLNEKFKGVMLTNAQLDNEKQILRYEVDLLKDRLEDLVDTNAYLQKSFLEKKRECSYQRMQITELNHRLKLAMQQLEARDKLLEEHDLVLLGGIDYQEITPAAAAAAAPPPQVKITPGLSSTQASKVPSPATSDVDEQSRLPGFLKVTGDPMYNGESRRVNEEPEASTAPPSMALISKDLADQLNTLPERKLEAQIAYLFSSRNELNTRIAKLEAQLEEERRGGDSGHPRLSTIRGLRSNEAELKQELQTVRSQAQEFKYKLQEEIQKKHALETDIVRLEGQIKRYKNIADTCEQQEGELRLQFRQCQREVRDMSYQVEDLKLENSNLKRKLEKSSQSSVAPGAGLPPP